MSTPEVRARQNIDTPLPKPPEVVEAALAAAPDWIDVPTGEGHVRCEAWPAESLREWHQRHGLLTPKQQPRKRK